jgi:RNA polymerase sigma-70 factor (ECF subfamily)
MGSNSGNTLEAIASAIPDEEVVTRVLQGETALFELIIRRHNQRLYRATRAILRDETEAEDAMQEAYVRAFCHLDQFAGDAKFSTWLTKIAVYEALGRLRRAKTQAEVPETMKSTDNPEKAAYHSELQRAIEAAVDTLPPRYRSVFVLREIEDMSGAETAECLGINEVAVKTRLHRARRMLRARLERTVSGAAPLAFGYGEQRCDRMTRLTMARIEELSGGLSPESARQGSVLTKL